MASSPVTTRLTFASKLRTEMARREMGARTLARLIDPTNVEQARRSVRRWVKGTHVPTQASRDQITAALGMERGSLDPDPDEDDEDPAVRLRLEYERRNRRNLDEYLRELAVLKRDER